MAISQICLLTTPSLAVVTCSLFCPPQQCSLSSLGCGQRRLCQPRAVCPTPHSPPHTRPRTHHSTQQVPACLPACTPLGLPTCWNASAGKGPASYTGEWLLRALIDYLKHLGNREKVFLESQNAWEKCYPGLADPEVRMAATKLREWEQHQEKPTQIWTQEERSMKGFVVECLKVPQPNLKAS